MSTHTDLEKLFDFITSFAQKRNRTPIWVHMKK